MFRAICNLAVNLLNSNDSNSVRRSKRRRVATASERLEDRRLLAWTSSWDSSFGDLTVSVSGPQDVEITEVAGELKINGSDVFFFGSLQAADVRFLTVTAVGEFDNLINLASLSPANLPALQVAQVFAGPGNDTIFGPEVNSTLNGEAGDDFVSPGDEDDHVLGGAGDDLIVIRGGEDQYDGGEGNDYYRFEPTAAGQHTLADPSGIDTIDLDAFTDVVFDAGNFAAQQLASNTHLTLTPGVSIEALVGGPGDDVLYAMSGVATILSGGDGNDALIGNTGDDWLDGGTGTNVLAGNAGNDTYWIAAGHSKILDTAGVDAVDFTPSLSPVTFNFDLHRTNQIISPGVTLELDTDTLIETAIGTGEADTFIVSAREHVDRRLQGRLPVLNSQDHLFVDYLGFPGDHHSSGPGEGRIAVQGGSQGKSFGIIDYAGIEQITELNRGQVTSDLVLTGSDGDDRLFVNATGVDSGTYRLDIGGVMGPLVPFAGITSLTFNAGGGNDLLQIGHPSSSLFQPAGGIDFHGGSGLNQLNLFDGLALNVDHAATSLHAGTVAYQGTTAVRFDNVQRVGETSPAAHRTVKFASATGDLIRLRDFIQTDLNVLTSTSAFELFFANPTASLRVQTAAPGSGTATVEVSGLDAAFSADLEVVGDPNDSLRFVKSYDSQQNLLPINLGAGMLNVQTGAVDFAVPVQAGKGIRVEAGSTASFQTDAIVLAADAVEINAGDILMTDGSSIQSDVRDVTLRAARGSVELSQLVALNGTVRVEAAFDIDPVANALAGDVIAGHGVFATQTGSVANSARPLHVAVLDLEATSGGDVFLRSSESITVGLADSQMNGIEARGVVDLDVDSATASSGILVAEGITSYAENPEAIRLKAWAGTGLPGDVPFDAAILIQPRAGLYAYSGGVHLESMTTVEADPDSYITAAGTGVLGSLSISVPGVAPVGKPPQQVRLLGSFSAKSATISGETVWIAPSSSVGNTLFFLAPTEVHAHDLSVSMSGLRSDIEFIPDSASDNELSVLGLATENAFEVRSQVSGLTVGHVNNAMSLPGASIRFRAGVEQLSVTGGATDDRFTVDAFPDTHVAIEGAEPDVPTPGDQLFVSGMQTLTTLQPNTIGLQGFAPISYHGIETVFVTDTRQIDVVGTPNDDSIDFDLSSAQGPIYLTFGSPSATSLLIDQLPGRILAGEHGPLGDRVSWQMSDQNESLEISSLGIRVNAHDVRLIDVEQQLVEMSGGNDTISIAGDQVIATNVFGGAGNDLFQVSPSRRGVISVDGQSGPDTLVVDAQGSLATDTGTEIQVLLYDSIQYRNMEVVQVGNNVGRTGDLNGDNRIDAVDLDLLCGLIGNDPASRGDFNRDHKTDRDDLGVLVHDVLGTHYGDANLDGRFNSTDLIQVFQAGEYEDGVAHNSTWAEGDWNCDGEFDTSDLVLAFQDGGYTNAAKIALPPAAVDLLFATTARSRQRLREDSAADKRFQ